jgi:hypothetical protein
VAPSDAAAGQSRSASPPRGSGEVAEKVFGFLLAALAVQLALDGLSDLGVIHLIPH